MNLHVFLTNLSELKCSFRTFANLNLKFTKFDRFLSIFFIEILAHFSDFLQIFRDFLDEFYGFFANLNEVEHPDPQKSKKPTKTNGKLVFS